MRTTRPGRATELVPRATSLFMLDRRSHLPTVLRIAVVALSAAAAALVLPPLLGLAAGSLSCTGCHVDGEGSDIVAGALVAGIAGWLATVAKVPGADEVEEFFDRKLGEEERPILGNDPPSKPESDAPPESVFRRTPFYKTMVARDEPPDNELPTREPGPQSRYSAGSSTPPDEP